MRTWRWALLFATLTPAAYGAHQAAAGESATLTPARASEIESGVRAFTSAVAHDVSQNGPIAWRKHFSDSPSFFMASEGRLVFPNSTAATAGIQDLVRIIKQIELRWGDDLRVDPLAPGLAVVAASYHELRVNNGGQRVEEDGFFTGTAEYRDGRWQFRNAHWSVAVPPPAVP